MEALMSDNDESKAIRKKQYCGDKSLRSFVIPEGTTEIGDWAFSGCQDQDFNEVTKNSTAA